MAALLAGGCADRDDESLGSTSQEVVMGDQDWDDIKLHMLDVDYPSAYNQSKGVADINISHPLLPRGAQCSAFLVARDLLMTGAHCVREDGVFTSTTLNGATIVATFGLERDPITGQMAASETFNCDTIVDMDVDLDVAILRCSRKPDGRYPGDSWPVLPLARENVTDGNDLYVLSLNCKEGEGGEGQPCMPQRRLLMSPGGNTGPVPDERFDACHVLDDDDTFFVEWEWMDGFEHNCDTRPGSSGAPVLRKWNGKVYGLVSGHNWDGWFGSTNRAGGVWQYVADHDTDLDAILNVAEFRAEDLDGDGWTRDVYARNPGPTNDCNDANPDVFPFAIERCDGVDNNCDGRRDEGYPDLNSDGVPDCNDPDDDADGDLDTMDNCPRNANPDQANQDGDARGDVCDACKLDPQNDVDVDEICGNVDNCPTRWNRGQRDFDGDGQGDDCDTDDDNDGQLDAVDLCPKRVGPSGTDVDNDKVGSNCDNCPNVANTDQGNIDHDAQGDVCDPDDDGDLVNDGVDNCPWAANPDQTDADGDGFGDACDRQTTASILRGIMDARLEAAARLLLGKGITSPDIPLKSVPKCPQGCEGPWSEIFARGTRATEAFLGGWGSAPISKKEMERILALDDQVSRGQARAYLGELYGPY